jgi:phage-related minor tail protein
MRSGPIIMIVFLFAAGAVFAQTDQQKKTEDEELKKSYLYQWTDDKGVVHITDGLGKVPEKYRDKAVKLETPKRDESGQGEQRTFEQSTPAEQNEEREENNKAEWQQRMKLARQRLTDAERSYQELDQKRNEALVRWAGGASGRIEDRMEAERIEQEMKEAQKEKDDARREVEVVIPEAARKAGVPPGWLR